LYYAEHFVDADLLMDVGELHFVHFAEAAETPEDAADVDLEQK